MDTSAQGLIQMNSRLRTEAAGMASLWIECGRMCMTRKVSSLAANSSSGASAIPTFSVDAQLFNSVAVEANKTLAAGCVSWITPSDTPWFVWKPAAQLRGKDSVESWLQTCTEIAQQYLGASNFYNRIHEVFLDRGTFGTGCLAAQAGADSAINFRAYDVGSFVLMESEDGTVDTLCRERVLTAKQAEELFPGASSKVTADLSANKPTAPHRFLEAVYPRPERERNPSGGPGAMKYAATFVHVDEKAIVRQGGYEELPFFATRYLKWSESSPYGASPAMEALAEIRGVNYLELMMTTLAELTVNPRIILPQGYQGVPDLRAGGLTMGGLGRDTHPTEWLTGGRFDVGVSLIERKERAIEAAFHKPLFDQFASLERQITAAEVRAREAEKLARFSPAFTQLTTEIINPVLERVFMLLFRAGKFPPPPREALVVDALGQPMLLFPQTVQTSRMALAMQGLKKSAFATMLDLFAPLAAVKPEVFDNLDEDKAFRDLTRGDGMPDSYLRESEAVEAIRKARAEAQQAAQQAEMAREAIKSKPLVEAGLKEMA